MTCTHKSQSWWEAQPVIPDSCPWCRIREMESQLERSRAANVYDANAHRRVSEMEAALRQVQHDCLSIESVKGKVTELSIRTQNAVRECFPAETACDPRGKCSTCGVSGEGNGFCSNPYHLDFKTAALKIKGEQT